MDSELVDFFVPPEPAEEDRRNWDFPYAIYQSFDCPPPQNFERKLETGVNNGDCLLACFAATLEALHRGHIQYVAKQPSAAKMREDLVQWIKDNWENYPIFNMEMKVHELMWMAHDMGITASERATRGEWGETPEDRLKAYSEQCDKIYFSDAEMLLFSSMMFEKRGIPIVFRTWRCTGMRERKGEFISTTPDRAWMEANGMTEAVVVDLSHTGRVDGTSAHYKVLNGGSLFELVQTKQVEPPPKKRRLTKNDDLTEEDRARLAVPDDV